MFVIVVFHTMAKAFSVSLLITAFHFLLVNKHNLWEMVSVTCSSADSFFFFTPLELGFLGTGVAQNSNHEEQ